MHFDFVTLKVFVSACEQQSISRAAEIENIAASAASKRISDLEKSIKCALFHRGPKGISMTASAHSFLHHARIILRDVGQLETEFIEHSKGIRGRIRLHASFSVILQQTPRDISEFLQRNPGVRLDLEEGTSHDAVRAVLDKVSDVGIFGGTSSVSGLQVWPYRTETLCVIMHQGHPLAKFEKVTFNEIADHDLISPQVGSFLGSLILRAEAELNRPLKRRVRTNQFETASRLVEEGLGIALVPEFCAKRYTQNPNILAVQFDERWAKRHWRLCARREQRPPLIEHLLQHLTRAEKRETVVLKDLLSTDAARDRQALA
jgi:DNA-binding transcriptional LysR family regulator